MAEKHFDVLIIGGGVIGASIAYHLLHDDFYGTVGPPMSLPQRPEAWAASDNSFPPRLTSRPVFTASQPLSVLTKRWLLVVNRRTARSAPTDIFCSETEITGRPSSVDVEIVTPDDLIKRYPQMNVEDVAGGSLGRRAGYMDAYGVMQGYLRRARSLGASYIQAEDVKIVRKGQKVTGVKTADDKIFSAGAMVLSAGAWSGEIARAMGLQLPVIPSPKMAFHVDPAEKFDYDLPFIFNPDGSWFRHETGQQIICGFDRGDAPGFRFDWDRDFFNAELWPRLYNRFKTFDRLKLMRGWGGLYAVNTLDHNALLGTYPGIENLYVATGFSGHGLMQSPAAGKGISELIRNGRYDTVDLSPLSVERIFTKKLIVEEAIY